MYKHILVAIGTSLSETALRVGIETAKASGARLTALHVIDQMPWWAVAAATHDLGLTLNAVGEHTQTIISHFNEQIQRAGIDATMRTVTLTPNSPTIAQAIAHTARALNADLIVTGESKQARWWLMEKPLLKALRQRTNLEMLIAEKQNALKPPHCEMVRAATA
jgi:universal stress protein A